eukprot:scaffold21551_cov71-Phaeocystis_antarctica.AAC.1
MWRHAWFKDRSADRDVRNLGDASAGQWCRLLGSSWYERGARRPSSLEGRVALFLAPAASHVSSPIHATTAKPSWDWRVPCCSVLRNKSEQLYSEELYFKKGCNSRSNTPF